MEKIIDALEDELNYWLKTQIASFSKNDKIYTLLRYYAPSAGPRPESYLEDYRNSFNLSTAERRQNFFTELKSAAESGWEFSSRWFVDSNGEDTGPLVNTKIDPFIPVDLNAIFANALQSVSYYHRLLFNPTSVGHWGSLAKQWRSNIEEVFWNEDVGVWLDYDVYYQKHRNYFYSCNLAPLWMSVVKQEDIAKRAPSVIRVYIKLVYWITMVVSRAHCSARVSSGTYPTPWPPLVSIFVNSVEAWGTEESKKISFMVAQDWVRAS